MKKEFNLRKATKNEMEQVKEETLSEKAFWIDAGKCVGHSYNPSSERAKRRIKESFRNRRRFYYKDVASAVKKLKERCGEEGVCLWSDVIDIFGEFK